MGKSRSKRHKSQAHPKRKKEQEQEQDRKRRNTREREEDERVQDQGEDGEQSPECTDEFSSFIKREIHNLILYMTTQFGLLEVLASDNVLTQQVNSKYQSSKIKTMASVKQDNYWKRSRRKQFQVKKRKRF